MNAEALRDDSQLQCLADIREAVGDPSGKLMQDELFDRIRAIVASEAALRERIEIAPTARIDCTVAIALGGFRLSVLTEEEFAAVYDLGGKRVALVVVE